MQTGGIASYQAQDGQTSIDVRLENETNSLRQEQIAQLFDRERSVIPNISIIFLRERD